MYAKDFCFSDSVSQWADGMTLANTNVLASMLTTGLVCNTIIWHSTELDRILPDHIKVSGSEDLLRYLPAETRPIVLMAYLGSTGTRTPLHQDKIHSIAYNVHVHGSGTKRWWMIDARDTDALRSLLQERGRTLHCDDYWLVWRWWRWPQ
jgi:hypothetical protein